MSDFRLKDILMTMRDTFKDVCPNVFTSNRPKSIGENMDAFIVVSLPVFVYNKTYGNGYGMTSSYCRIEIFVRDYNGIEMTAKLEDLMQKCLDKFPINNDFVTFLRPRVMLSEPDGYGFHVATIQASLITK